MADNNFDLVIVWDNLGGAVRVNAGGKAVVTDPTSGDLVTVVQGSSSVSTITADDNGRASFVAQQGIVKLTAGGLSMIAVSAEQATAGATNAALAQAAQTAAETAQAAAEDARDDVTSGLDAKVNQSSLPINVMDYDATGDGTTDDSSAIRDALAAAATAGSPTFLPAGTYVVSQDSTNFWCLDLAEGARLTGPGTLKMAASQVASVRMLRVAADNVTVQDVTLDLNRANQSGESNPQRHGIYVLGADALTVSNVTITGCPGDGILLDTGTTNTTVIATRITDCERNGITLYGNTADTTVVDGVTITGCHIEADVQAVDSEPTNGHVDNVRIIGNHLETTGDNYALTTGAALAETNTGWLVVGNTIKGGVYATALGAASIVANLIDARDATSMDGVHAFYGSELVTLAHNIIYTAENKYGINLALASSARPSGWKIIGNTVTVTGSTARAIYVGGAGPITIQANTLRGDNAAYGMYLQASGDMEALTVHGNELDGFATGILAAPFSTFSFELLAITGNSIVNTQDTPTATYGVRLTGTVAQFLKTVVYGNVVDAGYTSPIDLSTVLVRTGGDAIPTLSGSGTPQSVVTAKVGTLYVRRDGGTSTTLYVKESGTGNTGWVAK